MIDHDWLLHRLGLNPRESTPYQAFRAGDAVHQSVGVLYLSCVEARGFPILSPAARALLERQRHRLEALDGYSRMALNAAPSCQVVKGATIRPLYEDPLCRSQTDVDLAFAEAAELWRAAARIQATDDFEDPHLTLVEGDPTHAYIAFERSAPDVFFDKPLLVELSHTPFFGDRKVVPLRRTLPTNPYETSLLAICEERFQREFHLRDLIDATLLLRVLENSRPGWNNDQYDLVERFSLAPELHELWSLAADAGLTAAPKAWLDSARRAEASRREQQATITPGSDLYGLLVHDEPQRDCETPQLLKRPGEKSLLLTTVGTFLLTPNGEVSEEEVHRARAFVTAQLEVTRAG